MRPQRFPLLIPVLMTLFLLAACADVGDAPKAETGEATAVNSTRGMEIPIDTARSKVLWKAAKVTRSHDGGFQNISGTVSVMGDTVTGARIRIDTRSIWTDTDRLTEHLRGADFFNVDQFPDATFEIGSVAPKDSAGATHLVTGNLTMHGQTQGITFPATIRKTGNAVYATADFIIDRTRWGINYKGAADDLINNDVRLILDIVAATPDSTAGAAMDSVTAAR